MQRRVLYVHDRFGALGGAESNLLVTARELKQRGHAVAVLHGPSTGLGEKSWQDVFPDRFALENGREAASVANAIAAFQPEVIYVHKTSNLELLEALLATSLPLVRMVHDHDLYCMRSSRYNFFTRRNCSRALSPFCMVPCGAFVARNRGGSFPLRWVSYTAKVRELELNRRFDRMIVATRFMKQELLRNGFSPERIEVRAPVPMPGGDVPESNFGPRNLIIFAGQIIRGKAVDVLLKALSHVRVPFECYIFGEGDHRAACERLNQRLGLEQRVHFRGYVPPEELKLCYRDASLAVVSSLWPEPFGAVGLEGMRHGLPVVAFDAGGIREWLVDGFNGFLVPWADYQGFARRIEDLLNDKDLGRRMGQHGRTMIAEQFGFSQYLDGLEDLFGQLASPPQPAHAINTV